VIASSRCRGGAGIGAGSGTGEWCRGASAMAEGLVGQAAVSLLPTATLACCLAVDARLREAAVEFTLQRARPRRAAGWLMMMSGAVSRTARAAVCRGGESEMDI
jgi:hypothetical protein